MPVTLKTGLLLTLIACFTLPVSAQQDTMQACGAEWQKIKKKNNGDAPKGMTWKEFLSDCRERIAVTKAKSATKKTTTNGDTTKAATQTVSTQSVMKICGAEWQKVKKKNKGEPPKGMTWKKFLSECRKRQPKALEEKNSHLKPKKSVERSEASGKSMMSACSDDWRELKEKNNVPKGMTWTKYLSDCSKRYAGKFKPTKNQQAMYRRIQKCGKLWREAKDKGRLEKGITWPQYWSDCNARLKPRK